MNKVEAMSFIVVACMYVAPIGTLIHFLLKIQQRLDNALEDFLKHEPHLFNWLTNTSTSYCDQLPKEALRFDNQTVNTG